MQVTMNFIVRRGVTRVLLRWRKVVRKAAQLTEQADELSLSINKVFKGGGSV